MNTHNFQNDERFQGLTPFKEKVALSTPTMHGEEEQYIHEAFESTWVTTAGEQLNRIEADFAEYIGVKHAVALSSGTAALHLATRLAAERLYGSASPNAGTLAGKKVFCSDLTFDASINPVAYEDGEAVFIDTEYDTWNMDPAALARAFEIYPDVRLIVLAHIYGTPAKMDEIRRIAKDHHALIVEDAAESLGSKYLQEGVWKETGSFGDFNCISFNGNKIITGSSGGMFLTDSKEDADKVRKWSTQSREAAPWYQHEEVGYNYRMSNIIAAIIRGQFGYLEEHIKRKKQIYDRYKKGFEDLPVKMNPYDEDRSRPNFWLSSIIVDREAMGEQVRGDNDSLWKYSPGKTTPTELYEALMHFTCECRPIWKPMHLQPIYRMSPFITASGQGRAQTNAYIAGTKVDVGADIFQRGLCLPSDIKMTDYEQDFVIDVVHRCFK